MVSFVSVCINLGICYFSGAQGRDVILIFKLLFSIPYINFPGIRSIEKELNSSCLALYQYFNQKEAYNIVGKRYDDHGKNCQSLYLTNKVVFIPLLTV